jgi:hypothetical protein
MTNRETTLLTQNRERLNQADQKRPSLRILYFSFALDGKERTVADVAEAMGEPELKGITSFLMTLKANLVAERSEYILVKHAPDKGSRANKWSLQLRGDRK